MAYTSMQHVSLTDEEEAAPCCGLLSCAHLTKPVEVEPWGSPYLDVKPFWKWPFLGPLLFDNDSSDARDHAANERTFLSYLRLSVYMSIVAMAITVSFHLNNEATLIEFRMARPLGLVFWLLSVSCLLLGLGNYVKTVNKYSRKAAIVQSGWRTQSIMSLVALSIVGTCIILLVIAKIKIDMECDEMDLTCVQKGIQALSGNTEFMYAWVQ